MAEVSMKETKAIRLPGGGRMNYGMIIGGADLRPPTNRQRRELAMQQGRKLNSSMPKIDKPNIARDGGPKHIVDAPIKPGMTRQTKGEIAFHGGVAVDDLPNSAIIKSHERPIPLHSANPLSPTNLAKHKTAASDMLHEAANLGRGEKA